MPIRFRGSQLFIDADHRQARVNGVVWTAPTMESLDARNASS
ncbi:hypothetical protein AB0F17_45855 [Nonomuraea sp. NPDC026600]